MKKLLILIVLIPMSMHAQDSELPFSEIGEYPTEYGSADILSRMIGGLGYRYYWVTESLTETDLNYKPSEDGRTTFEVMEHIFGLTEMIIFTIEGKEYDFSMESMDYETLRAQTLTNLKFIQKSFNEITDLSALKVRFKLGEKSMEFPFWHLINGPASDAIWHCGQIVMNRRASGNPLNSKVNVFVGKTM